MLLRLLVFGFCCEHLVHNLAQAVSDIQLTPIESFVVLSFHFGARGLELIVHPVKRDAERYHIFFGDFVLVLEHVCLLAQGRYLSL